MNKSDTTASELSNTNQSEVVNKVKKKVISNALPNKFFELVCSKEGYEIRGLPFIP
jgi:hypothetical protein